MYIVVRMSLQSGLIGCSFFVRNGSVCTDVYVLSMTGCVGFFFNCTATTEIYTLSLHEGFPILYMPAGGLYIESLQNFLLKIL